MPEAINTDKAVQNLRDVEMFCDLTPEQLVQVASLCEFIQVERGYTLVEEGKAADCVFVLLKGEVQVVRQLDIPNISDVKSSERILTKITSEGTPLIGETALLSSGRRRSTVRSSTNCILYRILAGEMKALIEEDSEIGSVIYRQLAELLHHRLDSTSVDVVKLSAALVLALED